MTSSLAFGSCLRQSQIIADIPRTLTAAAAAAAASAITVIAITPVETIATEGTRCFKHGQLSENFILPWV